LSETPTDDSGRDLAAGFDPQHEWFWAPQNEQDDFRHLRQVAYVATRVPPPFINNITPNYQLPGFPPGACQNVLEVGDVVEGTPNPSFPVTLNGFTYHPQTLGLLQWFEGITPSDAINGRVQLSRQ
jgi:hypothetical protein